jgi:VanZ like family
VTSPQFKPETPRPSGRFLASAGLLFIAVATLVPLPEQRRFSELTPWWCLVCGDRGGLDVINNILLFIPMAVGLRLAGFSVRAVALTGAALSLSIELLQWTVVTGRDASLSDVLTNSLGSWLGAFLGTHLKTLLYPARHQAVRLVLAAGGLWVASELGSASLLRPWIPDHDLRGVWSRSSYGQSRFSGRVISATLSGRPLPGDSSLLAPELVRLLENGPVELGVELLSGPAGRWSPVAEVLGPRESVVAFRAVGKDLAYQPPARATLLRLNRPSLRLAGALSGGAGPRIQVLAGEGGSRLWAVWESGGARHRASLTLSPSFGWTLLLPFPYAYGPEIRWLTMFWLAGWLLPVGYWTAHVGGRPLTLAAALVLLVASGLALVPVISGYPLVHWSEWLGAFLGLAGGALGHRLAAYFHKGCDSPFIRESC